MSVGWRMRVSHLTEVRYAEPVSASFNEARMTPLALPTQAVLRTRLWAGPGTVPTWGYDDYWGTRVTVFEVPAAHDELVVRATATVETSAPARVPAQCAGWDEIRAVAARGRLLEYLLPTPLTALAPQDIDAALAGIAVSGRAEEAAEVICALVREHVAYVPGATSVRTGAQEAWHAGRGVCQDLAHVAVSLLRAAGLPARYVSGYLHPHPDPEPGVTAVGQGHAWAEYWAGRWLPMDPTLGVRVGERHIVVARGRDYADVPPLKGVYRGIRDSVMNVTVEVTRLA